MRSILVVCRSRKKKRKDTATILDRYLFRIGDRTWRGYASNACLDRISKDLRGAASRNMSVAVYDERSTHESRSPLFIVGSKKRFGNAGECPVAVSSANPRKASFSAGQRLLQACVGIAVLFHDIGKETALFQDKIAMAMSKGGAIADPVRHEIYSSYFFDYLANAFETDAEFLERCSQTPETLDFDSAHAHAAEQCMDLYSRINDAGSAQIWFATSDVPASKIRHAILQLILTHHRLPLHDQGFEHQLADYHVQKSPSDPRSLQKSNFLIKETLCADDAWLAKLRADAKTAKKHIKGLMPDLAVFGRTAMMMSDHMGSAIGTRAAEKAYQNGLLSDGQQTPSAPLANTFFADGKLRKADSLKTHVERVYDQVHDASYFSYFGGATRMPGLARESCPQSMTSMVVPIDQRFAWQSTAANAVKNMVSARKGGFFACIISRTGTGKTRAAPMVMSAATHHDKDETRRRLRFNLALNLRTLAAQSGEEYVHDLGFSRDEVATLVGGYSINWDDFDQGNSGSEDRLETASMIEARNPGEGVPEDGEETEDWLRNLGLNMDMGLSPFVESIIDHSQNPQSIRKMLATPILSATIDHFMPAADASRGGHIAQMMRVMSSDMIIDEIDLFSEEDLSAISRLAYIVGASGRRLIIMSATMPYDIAAEMYSSYAAGWKSYASTFGTNERVHTLFCGDDTNSVFTSDQVADFSDGYNKCAAQMIANITQSSALRKSYILGRAENFYDLAEKIDEACTGFHRNHHTCFEGMRISVGLIRLTRIAHVRRLAELMGPKPDQLRKYVYLHSNMPLAQRQHIERTLKKALTRKGSDPDKGLVSMLREYGYLQEAKDQDLQDISIIVISSPVIETGNDVDFDYAVIDPSSIRAVIQTAGRVNRHRNLVRDTPNIAILDEYLVSRFEGGEVSMPGVETKPARDTGIAKVSLQSGSKFIGGFVDSAEALSVIDTHVMFDPSIDAPILDAEKELRNRHFQQFPASDDFRSYSTARLSATFNKRRRFRRQEAPSIDYAPYFDGQDISSWVHKDRKKRNVEIQIEETEFPELREHMLMPEGLVEILQGFENEDPRIMPQGTISVTDYFRGQKELSISDELGFIFEQ